LRLFDFWNLVWVGFGPSKGGAGFDLEAIEHWSGSLSGSEEKLLVVGDEFKLVGTGMDVDVDA
jgi:hypothetical protein